VLQPEYDGDGNIVDIIPYYGESYSAQMLRYSSEYGTLI
jgi:dipeptidyl-peptidase-3